MKKFLFLAAILVLDHAQAFSCATRSASNCQTATGFQEEQRAGCAGVDTNCRRTFCESVCAPCPQAADIRNLCVNNCTGFIVKGSEAEAKAIHSKLAACFYLGTAASYENAAVSQYGNKDTQALASRIPDLAKDYKGKAEVLEQAILAANQAHAAATAAAEAIKAAAKKLYANPQEGVLVADNLIGLLNRQAQQKVGTYDASTQVFVTEGLSRRSSRRLARQASGF